MATVNAELELKMKQKVITLKQSKLQRSKLKLAEVIPKVMFKAQLRAIKLWKQRVNIVSVRTDLQFLDEATSSLKSDKTKSATDSRSLEMQLARFEVIEKEKDILEEDYQTSLAFSEDLLLQLMQIKRAKCQNCALALKVLKPSLS